MTLWPVSRVCVWMVCGNNNATRRPSGPHVRELVSETGNSDSDGLCVFT